MERFNQLELIPHQAKEVFNRSDMELAFSCGRSWGMYEYERMRSYLSSYMTVHLHEGGYFSLLDTPEFYQQCAAAAMFRRRVLDAFEDDTLGPLAASTITWLKTPGAKDWLSTNRRGKSEEKKHDYLGGTSVPVTDPDRRDTEFSQGG